MPTGNPGKPREDGELNTVFKAVFFLVGVVIAGGGALYLYNTHRQREAEREKARQVVEAITEDLPAKIAAERARREAIGGFQVVRDGPAEIARGGYWFQTLDAEGARPSRVRLTMTHVSGPAVDVLVMDKANFNSFQDGAGNHLLVFNGASSINGPWSFEGQNVRGDLSAELALEPERGPWYVVVTPVERHRPVSGNEPAAQVRLRVEAKM